MLDVDKRVFDTIKKQAGRSGVVRVSNDIINLITDIPIRTIQRALQRLEDAGKLERQTEVKKWGNRMVSHRDIVITDDTAIYKGFTLKQHRNLTKSSNHQVKTYKDVDGNVCTYEWWRRPSGEGSEWELAYGGYKEFDGYEHAWEHIRYSMSYHHRALRGKALQHTWDEGVDELFTITT